ncbi:hypothetical protein UPYG_G00011740 [Umbra pygmaea]|uniref:ERBB receptor feedback inhibitor 1 n=1 Tax=Umbra pygmaea TaxID=75934 RepID=A0ABD0XXJ3_UMBPY
MNNLAFSLEKVDPMEHSLRDPPQYRTLSQGIDSKAFQSHHPMDASSPHLTSHPLMHCTPEGDQVVPSFQKLSVYEQSPSRVPKPLPPLPDLGDISSDEAADSEVEFFIDERSRLLPQHSSPRAKSQALCYTAHKQRNFRGCGQVNYAYCEGSPGASSSASIVASSLVIPMNNEWAGSEARSMASEWTDRRAQEQQTQFAGRQVPGSVEVLAMDTSSKQPDRLQRSRLRRSHSGPTISFKPSGMRLSCHLHHHHHGSCRGHLQLDKPEVPPRIPIPQYPSKTRDYQHLYVTEEQDEDKPPKVPPREPIAPTCASSCSPSSKSLPIYVNGVMPPTQSFAPNPKYVSKGSQMLQQPRQGTTGSLLGPPTPCIVPIMEDGRKASTTHYFLLPRRPSYMDRFQRFL